MHYLFSPTWINWLSFQYKSSSRNVNSKWQISQAFFSRVIRFLFSSFALDVIQSVFSLSFHFHVMNLFFAASRIDIVAQWMSFKHTNRLRCVQLTVRQNHNFYTLTIRFTGWAASSQCIQATTCINHNALFSLHVKKIKKFSILFSRLCNEIAIKWQVKWPLWQIFLRCSKKRLIRHEKITTKNTFFTV